MKIRVAFAAALILAIAAGIGAKSVLDSFKKRALDEGHRITVIKARITMKPGDVLLEDKYEEVLVAGQTAHIDDITRSDLPQFLGHKVVRPVRAGRTFSKRDFYKSAAEVDFTKQVNLSYRAITIPVDQVTGVAGLIKPKDRVDVLATLGYTAQTPSGVRSMLETMTVLENVSVLAIDNRTAEHASIPERYRKSDRGGYTSVTLAVTTKEARIVTLAQAQAQGMLTLTLRNPADTSSDVARTNAEDLWGSIEAAAKVRRDMGSATPGER